MSNIRFHEIRRISLNKGDLVHRLGTRRLDSSALSAQMALMPVYHLHLLTYTHDKEKDELSTLAVPDTNGLR
jgi:hypothetical protein